MDYKKMWVELKNLLFERLEIFSTEENFYEKMIAEEDGNILNLMDDIEESS